MDIHSRLSVQNFDNWWYLHTEDLSEPKHEFLIKKRQDTGAKHFSNVNVFIECSNTMDGIMRILLTTTQAEKEKF